jgi:hypothetical protein
MKRAIVALAVGYVVLGLVTRAMEAAGLRTCTCYPDCWVRNLLRWVFPRFHHEMASEEWERQLDG